MRTFWLVTAVLACLALIGTVIVAPGRIHRVEWANETDGVREEYHKVLGFLPYSTTKRDPGLNVTDDAFRKLEEAGIQNLLEATTKPGSRVSRRQWPGHSTLYNASFELTKGTPTAATDFYARQLKSLRRKGPTLNDGIEGVCPDGKNRLTFTVSTSSGKNVAYSGP